MRIGLALRKIRDIRKISTRVVAERTGVSHTTYMDWERDKSSPSLRNFPKLARAFDMDPVSLMAYLVVEECGPKEFVCRESDIHEVLNTLQKQLYYFQAWYSAINLTSDEV